MNWILVVDIVYIIILVIVCLRIIYDTDSTLKTLAYLLFAIFVPVVGILFYFSFGINYRKRKLYSKKLTNDDRIRQQLETRIISYTETNLLSFKEGVRDAKGLVKLLLKDSWSPLTSGNYVKVLLNGEEKFPELLSAIREARHHIHIEYYIFDPDEIGTLIKNELINKARQGVEVRFIYDDFGSNAIDSAFENELKEVGAEIFPFHKVHFWILANRLNYRNHRKIVVIDGKTAFVGGINISDRYINNGRTGDMYWRDTHLLIEGTGAHYLQYLFFCDWNFCSGQQLDPDRIYFNGAHHPAFDCKVQVAASGPDSPTPTIMLSLLKAITIAREEILISTPYFIPGESILDALKVASLGGVKVKLLVPGVSDSRIVNAAAWSYYEDLLEAGVSIFLYRKGFIHAKCVIVDGYLSIVGTANMDYRSFDLNFEVNAVVYDAAVARNLRSAFYEDLSHGDEIMLERWLSRPLYKQMAERIARLLSPML